MANHARLQNAFYVVPDLPRARRFYEGLLAPSVKFADGERWVQYDAGGTPFALGDTGEGHPAMAGAAMVFETTDLDGDERTVLRLGGTVLGRRDMGGHGTSLIVADPDGNVLFLWARHPRP